MSARAHEKRNGYRKCARSAIWICLSVALLLLPGVPGGLKADRPDRSIHMDTVRLPVYGTPADGDSPDGDSPTAPAPIPRPADISPAAVQALYTGLYACADTVDLSPFALPVGELLPLFAFLIREHPELFHVAPRLSYAAGADGTVRTVYPAYTLTGAELTEARAFCRAAVEEYLDALRRAQAVRPFTEAEIALFLHDRLAARTTYDETCTNADAYALFRDGTGICQAYALAYIALCRAAGLSADFVGSDSMNHAWNHVRIDGQWYHVDVTRDDPLGGGNTVNHDRFLRSDRGLLDIGYRDFACAAAHDCPSSHWETDRACLADFHTPLIPTARGWLGTADPSDRPAAVRFGKDTPVTVTAPGDLDGSGRLTPADLLLLLTARPFVDSSDGDSTAADLSAWADVLRRRLVEPPKEKA